LGHLESMPILPRPPVQGLDFPVDLCQGSRLNTLSLRFLEGFSNPQIARMLGISQVLVAVIVHRTRQQLRKELRPYLGDRL